MRKEEMVWKTDICLIDSHEKNSESEAETQYSSLKFLQIKDTNPDMQEPKIFSRKDNKNKLTTYKTPESQMQRTKFYIKTPKTDDLQKIESMKLISRATVEV